MAFASFASSAAAAVVATFMSACHREAAPPAVPRALPLTAATIPARPAAPAIAKLRFGGEPWSSTRGHVAITAKRAGSGIRLSIARDDGRTLEITLPLRGDELAGSVLPCPATYLTTDGTQWTATADARARVTDLARDKNGRELVISASFDLLLSSTNEPRPLHVYGDVVNVSVP